MILKEEGRKILEDEGLIEILNSYGETKIVGSYDLDLLVKPDIDISISVNKLDVDKHFAISLEIAKKLKPSWVKYIDQSIYKLPFPFTEGYYLGLRIPRNDIVWEIDCWAFTPETFKERVVYHNSIKEKINQTNREILLEIKKEICHSPSYISVDLYNAILFEDVASLPEFLTWYRRKYKKDFTQN